MKRIVVILTIFATLCTVGITASANDAYHETDAIFSIQEAENDTVAVESKAATDEEFIDSTAAAESEVATGEESTVPSGEEDSDKETLPDKESVDKDALSGEEDADKDTLPDKESADEDALPDADTEVSTVFAMVYELVLDYATEILSALAAVASCLLALGYKKGLLPFLQQGLGVISGTVKNLGESAASANLTVCEQSEATRHATERIEESVAALCEGLTAVSERLALLEQASCERSGIREALVGQIDMLAEIFLASSLPEYRKEKIGATVAKLKAELATAKEDEALA